MTVNKLDRTDAVAVLASLMVGNTYDGGLVDKAVSYVAATGKKLDGTIHAAAVACIYLSMPHADGGHNAHERAVRLVNAMPKGSRVKALVAWFTEFSNLRINFDKKLGQYTGGVLPPTAKTYAAARPVEAMAMPFWTPAEAPPAADAFNSAMFANAVASLIKRATVANAALDAVGIAALADLRQVALKLPIAGKPAPVADAIPTMVNV